MADLEYTSSKYRFLQHLPLPALTKVLVSTPTCWNYVRGHCSYKFCKYYHPTDVSFPPYHRNSPFAPSKPLPISANDTWMTEEDTRNWREKPSRATTPTLYTPVTWKTAPCKHFVLTGNCSAGESCKFIHDLDLVQINMNARGNGHSLQASDVPKALNAHCWAFVQGGCKKPSNCRYFHPLNPEAYRKYTPCLLWPRCPSGDQCSFKHPKSLHEDLTPVTSTRMPAFAPVMSSLLGGDGIYNPSQRFYVPSPANTPPFSNARLGPADGVCAPVKYRHPHFSDSHYVHGALSNFSAYGGADVAAVSHLQTTRLPLGEIHPKQTPGPDSFRRGHARRISVPVLRPDNQAKVAAILY
ncbi:hypothetical protein F5880DRAFT_1615273 [Lentinula raphanica]|nr:hypothetical protein F5880DRAFT_1615273 [Lentinula raphanica]